MTCLLGFVRCGFRNGFGSGRSTGLTVNIVEGLSENACGAIG